MAGCSLITRVSTGGCRWGTREKCTKVFPENYDKASEEYTYTGLQDEKVNENTVVLNIAEGVTKNPDEAFSGLKKPKTRNGSPSTLTDFGKNCVEGCASLEALPPFTDGCTSIGMGAFYGCTSLVALPAFPNGCTSIGNGAFHGCSSLVSLPAFPDGCTFIGAYAYAFHGCTSLVSLPHFRMDVLQLASLRLKGARRWMGHR